MLPTNTPTLVTLGFRTGTGREGILQASWPGGDTQPPVALRYKLVHSTLAAATVSQAGADLRPNFVRLVVDSARITFEGQPTTWDGVGSLLANVSNPNNTVLEFAVTSDQITVAQQNEWLQKAAALARQHGFEYASFIGIHPLGSKGTSASHAKPQ